MKKTDPVGKELSLSYNVFDFQSQYLLSSNILHKEGLKHKEKIKRTAFSISSIYLSFLAVEVTLQELALKEAAKSLCNGKITDIENIFNRPRSIKHKVDEVNKALNMSIEPTERYKNKKEIRNAITHHNKEEILKINDYEKEAKDCFDICWEQIEELYAVFDEKEAFIIFKKLIGYNPS